jgi:acetyl esterase/lipase
VALAYQFVSECHNWPQRTIPLAYRDDDPVHKEHNVFRETNIPYVTRNGTDLLVDVVAPDGVPRSPRPAVIFVHGGGWLGGEKTTTANDWLAQAGFFTVSVAHSFTDVASFPTQIHDVKAAIRWV